MNVGVFINNERLKASQYFLGNRNARVSVFFISFQVKQSYEIIGIKGNKSKKIRSTIVDLNKIFNRKEKVGKKYRLFPWVGCKDSL